MSEYKGKLHETVVRFPQTDIWMDSCGEEELDYGLARGITGATSNPIIVGAVVKKELSYWEPRIRALITANPAANEDEITWLIIDEVGYLPFDADTANLFFQLIAHRYEQGSILVTSNMPFGRWGEIFADDIVAAAMIDRLVHHAEVINLKGDSYRLKDRDLGRTPAAVTTTEE